MDKCLIDELFLATIELADLAAEISRRQFRCNVEIESKEGTYPVTFVDREIEECLRQRIKKNYPEHGIIGEEFTSHAEDKKYVWVIDPIDGTAAYVTGKPTFTTLIALLEDGNPVIGVIDQSILNDRFIGVVDHGAWFNGSKLTSSKCTDLHLARLNVTTPCMFKTEMEREVFERMCREVKLTSFGGDSYAYGLLAAGHIDIIMEADLGYYDVASLVPIINASGGTITDWQGNKITQQGFKGQCLASSNIKLHKSALKVING